MSPSTNIDGTDITGATIDGQDVQEITVDGQTVFSAIPDSVVLQYFATTYNQSDGTWLNDVAGEPDMSITGDPQATTLSDGADALSFDGTDDYGLVDIPPSIEGSGFNQFSIEFVLEYSFTGTEAYFGVTDDGNTPLLYSRVNEDEDFNTREGKLSWQMRDANDNRLVVATSNDENLNDGNRHNIVLKMNDASTADLDIIIDGTSVPISTNTNQNENLTNWSALNYDVAFGGRNDRGSITDHFGGEIGAIRWHDTNSGQTIGSYS